MRSLCVCIWMCVCVWVRVSVRVIECARKILCERVSRIDTSDIMMILHEPPPR